MSSALTRANELYLTRNYEAALRLYLDALAEVAGPPLDAVALAGAGNCYELLGLEGRAIRLWRQALWRLRDGSAEGLAALAHQLQWLLDAYDRHPMAFISYAHVEEGLVRKLDRHLRRLGCRIRADYDAFVPGKDLEGEILRVMDECPNYVIAWSRAYRDRPYTRHELRLIRDLTAPERREGRSALLVALDNTPYPDDLQHLLMMRADGRSPRELARQVRRALGGLPLQDARGPIQLRRAARRVVAGILRTAGTALTTLVSAAAPRDRGNAYAPRRPAL
jgi:tetratricopeptide (TPR) repeat protein